MCFASCKGAEANAYVLEIMRAHALPMEAPTEILTDNAANLSVGNNIGQASASRHFLRRYGVLKRRVLAGECKWVKVADTENPADCLTRWVPMAKLRKSIEYMENSRAHVA